jgi:hypothetical protein
MLTTRIGVNSKMVITGDLNQTDFSTTNGLKDFLNRLNDYKNGCNSTIENIKIIGFEKHDVERSEVVKKIIDIYDYDKNLNVPINTNANATVLEKHIQRTSTKDARDNDAALIPKQHITKNTDIFWE